MNTSCIDPFIINSSLSFQNTIAVSYGFSNFHKMLIAVTKMSFKKHSPIRIYYKAYKYFETTFIEGLSKHAPLRKKFFRANHAPCITKTLRKAIMRRCQLETKYLKTKTQTDLRLYRKHKNFCSTL